MISETTITNPDSSTSTIAPQSVFNFTDMTQGQIDANHATILTEIARIKAAM